MTKKSNDNKASVKPNTQAEKTTLDKVKNAAPSKTVSSDNKAKVSENISAEKSTATDKKPPVKQSAMDSGKKVEKQVGSTKSTANPKVATKSTQATKKPIEPEIKEKDNTAKPTVKPQPAKKSGKKSASGLAVLALLLGVAGTILGAYAFNEVRKLKSTDTSKVDTGLSDLQDKFNVLSTQVNDDALTSQVTAINQQVDKFSQGVTTLSERLSAVEQMQKGLVVEAEKAINEALVSKESNLEALVKRLQEIELGQQGLVNNLSAVAAGTSAASAEGVGLQEVGYLLRMASYKVKEGDDIAGSAGMLSIAADKLAGLNLAAYAPLVDNIREKAIRLQGVTPVDTTALFGQLKSAEALVAKLEVKKDKAVLVQNSATAESATATSAAVSPGLLDQALDIVKSGVKFTPSDPNAIDISAESAVLQKRFIQADLRTAELAIQSRNKLLLVESLQSVKQRVDETFASTDASNLLLQALAQIEQVELQSVLPDLSSVVSQFEQLFANQSK